ncbi:hypothetical protein LEP1GSC045_0599 [Leptospira interrogans serovar Pomona str. Kennewicki LC82-25]|nr:hypothetical protein LEP1GSC045_0599 [Leptospira interrogans serovar Pomona str. Kennewicki LC82-25]
MRTTTFCKKFICKIIVRRYFLFKTKNLNLVKTLWNSV